MLNESDFDMSTGSAGAVNGDANPDAVFANNVCWDTRLFLAFVCCQRGWRIRLDCCMFPLGLVPA